MRSKQDLQEIGQLLVMESSGKIKQESKITDKEKQFMEWLEKEISKEDNRLTMGTYDMLLSDDISDKLTEILEKFKQIFEVK